MRLHIVMYHYVRDLMLSRYPAIKGLDVALFRQQLDFLNQNFTIVRMEDVLSAIAGASTIPKNAVLLTFDDGYIDHYNVVFPVLDKLGIQGSFFPPSIILENKMLLDVHKIHFILATGQYNLIYKRLLKEIEFYEWGSIDTQALINEYAVPNRFDGGEVVFIKRILQHVLPKRLRSLIIDKLFDKFVGVDEAVFAKELYCDTAHLVTMKKHGMFIGLHGYAHGWLGNMNYEEYTQDINNSLNYMDSEKLIDKNSWVIAYPYGTYNDGVLECIRGQNCALGLTTEVRVADLKTDGRFLLPRLDANDFPPKSSEYKKY